MFVSIALNLDRNCVFPDIKVSINNFRSTSFEFLFESSLTLFLSSILLFGLGFFDAANVLGFALFLLFVILTIMVLGKMIHEKNYRSADIVEEMPMKDSVPFLMSVLFGFALVLFAFRQNILNPGVINSTIVPFSASPWFSRYLPFSPLAGYAAGNSRFFISMAPINLITLVFDSIKTIQTTSLVLEFFLIDIVAVIVAREMFRGFEMRGSRLIFYLVFVVLIFTNPVFLTDGFVFTVDGLLLSFVLIISLGCLKRNSHTLHDVLRIAFATSFMVFLDPRFLLFMFLSFVLISFTAILFKLHRNFITLVSKSTLIVLPFIVLLVFMFHFNSTYITNFGHPATVTQIISYSTNSNSIDIWLMLGNYWPGFVFAPPTVIGLSSYTINHLSTYGFSNPMMIFVGGPLQLVFSLALGVLTFVSLLSIYFLYLDKTNNRFLSLMYVPFLVIFVIVLGGNLGITQFLVFENLLTMIPILGGIWSVAIEITPWLEPILVSYFLLFFSYSFSRIMGLIDSKTITKVKKKKRSVKFLPIPKFLFVTIVVFLLCFGSWQFFFPQYSLGARDPGITGNGVSTVGQYYPSHPPGSWLSFYQNISNNDNLLYSVFSNDQWSTPEKWDNGILSVSPPGISPNSAFNSLFSEIESDNLTSLAVPLSKMYGVKYFFIDNSTTSSSKQVLNFLRSSALKTIYSGKNLTVFEDPSASTITSSGITINSSSIDKLTIVELFDAYYSGLSAEPIFVTKNGRLNVSPGSNQNSNDSILFLNYKNLNANLSLFFPSPFENATSGISSSKFIYFGNQWNLFNQGGYYSYSINKSRLSISPVDNNGTQVKGDIILDYEAPMFNHVVDITIPNYKMVNTVITGNVSYSIYGNLSSKSSGSLLFPTNNASLINSKGATVNLPMFHGKNNVNFSVILPVYSRTFTASLQISNLLGTFNLDAINISYHFIRSGSVNLNGRGINLSAGPGSYELIESGYNNDFVHVFQKRTLVFSKPTNIFINPSNLTYVQYIALLPQVSTNNLSLPINGIDYNAIKGQLNLGDNVFGAFLAVSYNPNYMWKTSDNLKYIGTNVLGQQIYKVVGNGSLSLTIPQTYPMFLSELASVFFIYIGFPILIYVNLRRRKTPL